MGWALGNHTEEINLNGQSFLTKKSLNHPSRILHYLIKLNLQNFLEKILNHLMKLNLQNFLEKILNHPLRILHYFFVK